MGILDSVIGGLLGGGTGASSPMGSVLSSILGGGQSEANPGTLGGGGGLGGLLQQFQSAGLGHVAQSWVGMGQINRSHPTSFRMSLASSG